MAGKRTVSHKKQAELNPHEFLETFADLGKGVVTGFKNDLLKGAKNDVLSQFFGSETHTTPKSGDLAPGEVLNLSKLKQRPDVLERRQQLKRPDAAPAMDYHREMARAGEYIGKRESGEINRNIQQIMVELKQLVDSSSVLQTQFASVTVDQRPVTPGKYHQNFFEWMLIMIRTAKQKVQDSGAWLATMQSKKKSQQYGSMAKKHGTSFTLSNERTAATQTG